MFDLLSVTPQQLQDSHVHNATNHLALALLLIEKGIITDDELDKARSQAVHIVDQLLAKEKEKAEAEFDSKYPNIRKIFGRQEEDNTQD